MANELIKDPKSALDALAREELGLDPDNLGSPWGAAISSFLAFAVGAVLPLIPFFAGFGDKAIVAAAILAGIALFGVGAALSLFSGKSALAGGARMTLIGALAGAATYGVGSLFGVAAG
jgi:VIT1/CCC1 family predicted Fe2+/Mn2+ transporter